MAIATPTLHINESSVTSTKTYTTASFTPSANALLLVFASSGFSSQTGPITISSSFPGTWTNIQQNHPTGAWTATIGYMQLGASPGSGTVSATLAGAAGTRWVIHVVEIASGFNTTTPIAQSKKGTATTGTTFSLTLDSTPAAGSHVYGMIATRWESNGNIVPGTQFTEIADTNAGGTNTANGNQTQSQYDATSPGTTVDWSDLGTSITEIIGIAVEVQAATQSVEVFVSSEADDGTANSGGSSIDTLTTIMGYHTNSSILYRDMWVRFTGISGLAGATIVSALLYLDPVTNNTNINKLISAEAAATPVSPTNYSEFTGKTKTTAKVAHTGFPTGNRTPIDVTTIVQELANNFDPSAILFLSEDNGQSTATTQQENYADYANAPDQPSLYIEWESGSAAQTVTANTLTLASSPQTITPDNGAAVATLSTLTLASSPQTAVINNLLDIPAKYDWGRLRLVVVAGATETVDWDYILWAGTPGQFIKFNGTYFYYYVGSPYYDDVLETPADRAIGVATSADGENFTKYGSNPIITYTTGGSVEEGATNPVVLVEGSTLHMWYAAGVDAGGGNVDLAIRYRTSTDGFTWTGDTEVLPHGGQEYVPVGAFKVGSTYYLYYLGPLAGGRGDLRMISGTNPATLGSSQLILSNTWVGNRGLVPIGNGAYAFVLAATDFTQEWRSVHEDDPTNVSSINQSYQFNNQLGFTVMLDGLVWRMIHAGELNAHYQRIADTVPLLPDGLIGSVGGWESVALEDNFDDNSQDTAKWSLGSLYFEDLSVPVAEQNQRLEISPLASTTGTHYNGYQSVNTFDMTGAEVVVEVVQVTNTATPADTIFRIYLDADNYLAMVEEDGTLYLEVDDGGTTTFPATPAYNSTNHRWWRIRESGGTVFFDASSDGQNWNNLGSDTSIGFSLTAMRVELTAGTYNSVASPGTAIFDNFEAVFPTPVDSVGEHTTERVDTDYIRLTPTVGDYSEFSLSDPGSTDGVASIVWWAYDGGATNDCEVTVELKEGTTVIATDVETLTDTKTQYVLELTPAEKASIGDWTNLRLRVTVTAVP